MNFICRMGFHRWRYHDEPVSIRVCAACRTREYLRNDEWRDKK